MNPTPPRPVRRNSPAELAAFDRVCERLGGFGRELGFEHIDGFLAALAALPQPPEPADWLSALCGDAFERAFADPEDQAQAQAALVARLKVLQDQLDPEALLYDPDMLRLDPFVAEIDEADRDRFVAEYGVDADDAVVLQLGAIWAGGVLAGVAAFPDLWAPPPDEAAPALFEQAFSQLRALRLAPGSEALAAHVASGYPQGEPTRDDLLAEACMALQDLRLYWVDFAPKTATRRVEPTPGRNDPCPCGSGKKFKKCHGATAG